MKKKQRIAFLPCYFYLSTPYFEKYYLEIQDKSLPIFLRVSPTVRSFDNDYGASYFSSKNMKYKHVNLKEAKGSPLHRFIAQIRNAGIISRFLSANPIDQLVVTSDLGDEYVRIFLEVARRKGVLIKIINNFDVFLDDSQYGWKRKISDICYSLPTLFLGIVRAYFFNNGLLGSFLLKESIYLTKPEMQSRLSEKGISRDRIHIIKKNELQKEGKITFYDTERAKDYILVFTECIEFIYGESYRNLVYSDIGNILREYQKRKSDIKILVKFHPRETSQAKHFLRETFKDLNVTYILNEIPLDKLILNSRFCIAHFSAVLFQVLDAVKPFISINYMNDARNKFINAAILKMLEVRNKSELESLVESLLSDEESIDNVETLIKEYSQDLNYGCTFTQIVDIED